MADLPVRGVYQFFEMLDGAGALEAFLAECDEKKLTFGVSDVLFAVGERHFKRSSIETAGPPCPACPGPRGL
jgi:hypothetical protein